jgi:hypothetical protein
MAPLWLSMGTPIGGGHLEYLVPAGQTLTKTLAVSKGRALNYDNLKLALDVTVSV